MWFKSINNWLKSHWEKEWYFFFWHILVGFSFQSIRVHLRLKIFKWNRWIFIFEFFDCKFMFGIPHWVLFIGILSLWIRLKHFFKFSCSVVSFCYGHTNEELHFNDDVILFNIVFKCMFLKHLIIGSFGWFTEFTCTIHPSPEIFSWSNNVVWDVIKRFNQFSWCWSCSKVRMFIICFDLKQRIAFSSGRINGLIYQSFEWK